MSNILAIVSAKGGVGKSTIAANLAVALHALGHPTLAIDLDPQNALRFHFSLDANSAKGLVNSSEAGFGELIEMTQAGVALLPYGESQESQRRAFETRLNNNPTWLVEQLHALSMPDNAIVVLDTSPGSSVYMTQALTAATLALAVVLPDAGSYVTLPQMKSLFDTYCIGRPEFRDYGVVVNQTDQSRALNRDVLAMLRASFNERIIGRIHQDQSISEALAWGQSVLQYAPYSEGASDLFACAKWVSAHIFNESAIP